MNRTRQVGVGSSLRFAALGHAGLVTIILVTALGVAGIPDLARGATQTVLGKSFTVKDPKPGIDASRRSIVIVGKELQSDNLLVGDPTTSGAVVEIIANGANPTGDVFLLPPGTAETGSAGWKTLGNPVIGYSYKDRRGVNGPVTSAVIKKSPSGTLTLMVRIKGAVGPGPQPHITIVPPAPGTDGGMAFNINGGDTYCVAFGGAAGGAVTNIPTSGTPNKSFKIKSSPTDPTAQAGCPVSPAAPDIATGNAILMPGVQVLDAATEVAITASDDTSLTFAGVPGAIATLQPGDVFLAQNEPRRVLSVSILNGDALVQTETPEFGEVFETFQTSGSVTLSEAHLVLPSAPIGATARSVAALATPTVTHSCRGYRCEFRVGTDELSGTIVLYQPHVEWNLKFGIGRNYGNVKFKAKETADLRLSSPELSFSSSKDIPLPPFIVPIPVTGGAAQIELSLTLHLAADGSAQVSAGISQGIAYDTGIDVTLQPVVLTPSANITPPWLTVTQPEFNGEITATVAFNPNVTLNIAKRYSLTGIRNNLGLTASATANADLGNACSRLQVTADISSTAFVMLPVLTLEGAFSWDFFRSHSNLSMEEYSKALFNITRNIHDSGEQCLVPNELPIVDAGPGITVITESTVLLSGLASHDPDGAIASYAWTQLDGTPVTLMDSGTATPSFTAPATPGAITLQLTVTDSSGSTASTNVVITVTVGPGPSDSTPTITSISSPSPTATTMSTTTPSPTATTTSTTSPSPTPTTTSPPDASLQEVIVAGQSDHILRSTDGVNFLLSTIVPRPLSGWAGAAWNGHVWALVGNNLCQTSSDGITWTQQSMPTGAWRGLKWNGSVFLTVAQDPSNSMGSIAAISPDGVTWTTHPISSTRTYLQGAVGIFNATFCIYASASSPSPTWNVPVATSTNGMDWIFGSVDFNSPSGAGNDAASKIAGGPDGFVFAVSSDRFAQGNGVTWTTGLDASGFIDWKAAAYGAGMYTMVGAFGTVNTSDGTSSWTQRTNVFAGITGFSNAQDAAYSSRLGLFFVVSDSGGISTKADPTQPGNWNHILTTGGHRIVAVKD